MNNNIFNNNQPSNLFVKADNIKPFADILAEVQAYISKDYSSLLVESFSASGEKRDEIKAQVKRYISKYIIDGRLAAPGMPFDELVNSIYTEMVEFGFLTKYIFDKNVEEINVNSWEDVQVQYNDGNSVKLDEHFESPDHALNVIRRMCHVSGMVLDNSTPFILGHLSKNIRIAVLKSPLVDEDVGISASIRIVNAQKLHKEKFLQSGTATDDMMDMLSMLVRYGVSTVIAGATSSGKTTLCGWLLSTIPDNKRIYTIENGSRELDLVKRDENGKIINNVIHTLTKESDDPKKAITQEILLDAALRYHPDYIVVAEMRGAEANAAQEAARTGHAVITTIHSTSSEATWQRMVSLCKRAYPNADDREYLKLVTEAFPIVVYAKQLENKQRRITEIMECEILPSGERAYRSLYKYHITRNVIVEGKIVVEGYHEKGENLSDSLQRRLLENGAPEDEIKRFLNMLEVGEVA